MLITTVTRVTPLWIRQWYLMHGLIVDHVYQVVEYEPKPCFRHFGESVSTARRAGDADPDKAIIADTMKLLGNSGYGKTVTNIDRHQDVKYCTEVGTSALINNKRFRQLDVVTDDAYEIELNKQVVKYSYIPDNFFLYVVIRGAFESTPYIPTTRVEDDWKNLMATPEPNAPLIRTYQKKVVWYTYVTGIFKRALV